MTKFDRAIMSLEERLKHLERETEIDRALRIVAEYGYDVSRPTSLTEGGPRMEVTDEMVEAALAAVKQAAVADGEELDELLLRKYTRIGLEAALEVQALPDGP